MLGVESFRRRFLVGRLSFWIDLTLFLWVFIDLILIMFSFFVVMHSEMYKVFVIFDSGLSVALFIKFAYDMYLQTNRRAYVKNDLGNIVFDIVAMIPYELLFLGPWGLIRLFRVIRFLKIFVFLRKGRNDVFKFIEKTKMKYTVITFITVVIFSTIGIYIVECSPTSQIHSPFDAMWYVMVTISSVGYGDVMPLSYIGKIFGILIMIIGLVLCSLLTAGLSSWMLRNQDLDENELKNEIKELRKEINELKSIIYNKI